VVADAEVEAELRVGPQRAGLDLVEVLDQVERAQAAARLAAARKPIVPGGMSASRSITTQMIARV
jgi:hypothetical protein